ncbi:acyltransferase family protein [Sphingomonas ginkgonis]|uniref:acyltransferase family protein n=1 Tax=Sphingomonas ginkgonis TaxID=2315330 RepID=UPI00163A10A9|nr:acyltransferase [Sphingomonas ginkgonis]
MGKQRFVTLDGLRGLAALAVLLHHAVPKLMPGHVLLPAGYLSVDFFFLLSGFVISAVYEMRFPKGLGSFVRTRLVRLVPTMWCGILLGALLASWRGMDLVELRLSAALLFIPLVFGNFGLFALNGVQWSLYFELVANYVHGLLIWRMPTYWIAVIALCAYASLGLLSDHFGSMAFGDRDANFAAGYARVAASYLGGVLVFRSWQQGRLLDLSGLNPFLLFALVMAISCWFGPKFDFAAVLVWPLVLIAGIQHQTRFEALCAFGGAVSFPLYAVHLPIVDGTLLALGTGASQAAFACVCALGVAMLPMQLKRLRSRLAAAGPVTSAAAGQPLTR